MAIVDDVSQAADAVISSTEEIERLENALHEAMVKNSDDRKKFLDLAHEVYKLQSGEEYIFARDGFLVKVDSDWADMGRNAITVEENHINHL